MTKAIIAVMTVTRRASREGEYLPSILKFTFLKNPLILLRNVTNLVRCLAANDSSRFFMLFLQKIICFHVIPGTLFYFYINLSDISSYEANRQKLNPADKPYG